MNRTHVIGFWLVPNNPKRDPLHYCKYLSITLDYLSSKDIVFFSNSKDINQAVESFKSYRSGSVITRFRPIEELTRFKYGPEFLRAAKTFGDTKSDFSKRVKKDKGDAHYYRDYLMGTEMSYKSMLSIWHSKVQLLCEIARENPFNSDEFCWVDASVSRSFFNRRGWDFKGYAYEPGTVGCFPNGMRKRGVLLRANASVILTDAETAAVLEPAYEKFFQELLPEGYPNDEEIVLDAVFRENPHLLKYLPESPSVIDSDRVFDKSIFPFLQRKRLKFMENDAIGQFFRPKEFKNKIFD